MHNFTTSAAPAEFSDRDNDDDDDDVFIFSAPFKTKPQRERERERGREGERGWGGGGGKTAQKSFASLFWRVVRSGGEGSGEEGACISNASRCGAFLVSLLPPLSPTPPAGRVIVPNSIPTGKRERERERRRAGLREGRREEGGIYGRTKTAAVAVKPVMQFRGGKCIFVHRAASEQVRERRVK